MYARRQSLLIGDPPQECGELFSLLSGECGAQGFLMFARHLPNRLQCAPPFVGQVERIRSPILRFVPTFNELALLEFVDQRDEPARHHPEPLTQGLLAQSF
jgi:hypothetical protein